MPNTPEELENKALLMRRAGLAPADIAKQLGFDSPSDALDAIKAALDRTREDVSEAERRDIELQRLDIATRVTMKAVAEGDLRAVDRLTKIYEMRQKIELAYTDTDDLPCLREKFDVTVKACEDLDPSIDAALIQGGRQTASYIDRVMQRGSVQDAAKALYLIPHLNKTLDKMMATPSARAELQAATAAHVSRLDEMREARKGRGWDEQD